MIWLTAWHAWLSGAWAPTESITAMPMRSWSNWLVVCKRGLAPIYLIGGEEPLLLQECCDQVREAAKAQGFVERELLQVDRGFDWSELEPGLLHLHYLLPRKLSTCALRTGKPGQKGAKVLTEWAEAPNPNMILLVSCEQWDTGSRKSKWASQSG